MPFFREKPFVDGRGVGSDIPKPRPSPAAVGCEKETPSGSAAGGCSIRDVSVSIARGFNSRLSRAAPRPSRATFRSDPFRFRVFCCWERAPASARGGLPAGSEELSVCRDSLRLDLLSELRKKGNFERMLPPEPLLLRPAVAVSGDDAVGLCASVEATGVFSIIYRISSFVVL